MAGERYAGQSIQIRCFYSEEASSVQPFEQMQQLFLYFLQNECTEKQRAIPYTVETDAMRADTHEGAWAHA